MEINGIDVKNLLEDAMTFRVARQSVLAANVANVDTPDYKRSDVEFSHSLDNAVIRLSTTDPAHRGYAGTSDDPWTVRTDRIVTRSDGNGVDLDREAIELNRNAGAFEEMADLYARLAFMTRIAITGSTT